MRIWWVLHCEGWRSRSVSFGKRSDSPRRIRTRADPRAREGLSGQCERVLESVLSPRAPYLNGISQRSFLNRKTYHSRGTVKGDTNGVLSTAQGPLVFMGMKIFWGNTEFVQGNHSALSTMTEMQSQGGERRAGSNVHIPVRWVTSVPAPPRRRGANGSSLTIQGQAQDWDSFSTCIYIKAALSWNMQISLLMGFLCKIFLEPES